MNLPTRIAVSLLVTLGAVGPAAAESSNKWRIEVDEVARSAGEVELSFAPVGAQPTSIHIAIPAGTREDSAALMIGLNFSSNSTSGV